MTKDTYFSIEKPVQAELKEKGSKFLSFAIPVKNETDIKAVLNQLKSEYWDASHHCYAYVLGPKHDVYRANDAGEPNHSAGDPILSQIRSFNVTDTLLVVVRYFGGTKLGVSGLIAAYKSAAREALGKATIIEKYLTSVLKVKFTPAQTSWVMKTLKVCEATVLSQDFDYETMNSVILFEIRRSMEDLLTDNLKGALGVEVSGNL